VVIPKGSIPPVWILVAIGALFLLWFFLHIRSAEKKGRDADHPVAAPAGVVLPGLGLPSAGQPLQRHQDGPDPHPGTIGILVASAAADRFARRHPQRWLIIAGFCATAAGLLLLLLSGIGVGTMLTSSVNVVQSSFPEPAEPAARHGTEPPSSRLGDYPPVSPRL
jgi:hypothetical protein